MKPLLENLNIALVHDWLTNMAGAEKVVLLMTKMFPKAPLFTSVYDRKKTIAFDHVDVRTSLLQNVPFSKAKREVLIPLTPFAFEQFDLSDFDIVISSTTMAAKGVLTKPETMHICYCNTPPRYLWEPEVDPRADTGLFKGLRKKTSHKLRIWDRVAADRVDYFIGNSKYIARRIKKYYQRDAEVIYPPVDIDQFKTVESKKVKDYYLFVSRLVGYKKCDLVIEAFNELGLPLKIIGSGPDKKILQKKAKSNIEFLGFLSDAELVKYYSEAKAFVFAAEEDFGIVPVEAMASGRPVIAFGRGGATETVVEGVTGTFFDKQTKESLMTAVKRFNPCDYDPSKIRFQVEKFSQERFKRELKSYIEKCLSDYRKP